MRKLIALLILLLCCGNCYALSGYSFTGQISVDETKVIADTTDFTVTLTSFPDAFYTACESDGASITVTQSDQTTKIDRKINGFSKTNKTLVLKFKAPSLSTTANTIFYLYAGKTGASETNANPYGSGYKAVFELEDAPSGTAYDDTSNDFDMTSYGSMDSNDLITGKIGKAYDFDGSNDYIRKANAMPSSNSSGTIYAWVKSNTLTTCGFFGVGEVVYTGIYLGTTSGGNIRFFQRNGFETYDYGEGNTVTSTGTWYFIAFRSDNNDYFVRVNSTNNTVTIVSGSNTGDWFDSVTGTLSTVVGASNYSNLSYTFFNGSIDYFHITNDYVSDNDLGTIYNMTNDNSTFYTVTEQSAGTSIIPQAQYYYNLLRSNNQ